MATTILIIILAILIFNYILERVLDYLNSTLWSDELPEELSDFYDAEKYKKSQDYEKQNHRLSVVISSLSFIAMILMIVLGGFAYVDSFVRQYTDNPIILSLLFFGILGFLSDLLSTPFAVYSTFVIEEKFGFNKTTPSTFITDKLKGWLLSALIGGGILALVVWLYEISGNYFWLLAWGALSLFTIFMNMFYSTLIVPLFNKQKPLEEGELRDAIEQFAVKAKFKLDNIFIIDGSKRSSKANAYFSGIGPKKRVVLYDTLIDDHSTEELVAVLAHEIGHYKMKHNIRGMISNIVQSALMFFLLSLFIAKDSSVSTALAEALGAKYASFYLGLLVFGILYSPLSMILGLWMNIVSRKDEYKADKFAAINYHAGPLISALKKLSVKNLSNLRPHPAYVFFYYSHPTLLQRLKALKSYL
jgi:STE24 endopeptidase